MTKKFLSFLFVAFLLILLGISNPAHALILDFYGITNNDPNDPGAVDQGESYFSVEITDALGGEDLTSTQVLFTFINSGPTDTLAHITEIYFDDGSLLGIHSLIEEEGVDYTYMGVNPPNLPSGNEIGFVTTAGFAADPESPEGSGGNGIDGGESLGILFDLQNDPEQLTLANVLADLGSGALRIGIHGQGLGEGGAFSESFVNNPVPEPSTIVISSLMLLGMGIFVRRKIHS